MTPKDSSGTHLACAKFIFSLQGENLVSLQNQKQFNTQPIGLPPWYTNGINGMNGLQPDALVHSLRRQYNLGSTVNFKWSSCSKPSDLGKLNSLTFDGHSLGTDIHALGKGTVTEVVGQGASYRMDVSSAGVPLLTHTDDLCKDTQVNLPMGLGSVKMAAIGCPLAKGAFSITETIHISPIMMLPSADFTLTCLDAQKKELFCVAVHVTVSKATVSKANRKTESMLSWIPHQLESIFV